MRKKAHVFFRRRIDGNRNVIGYVVKDSRGIPREKTMVTDSTESGIYLPWERNEFTRLSLYPKHFEALIYGGLFNMTIVSDGIFFNKWCGLSVIEREKGISTIETDKERYPYPYMQEDVVLFSSSLSQSDPTARLVTGIPLRKGNIAMFSTGEGISVIRLDDPSREKRIYGFPVAVETEETGRLYALPYFFYDTESEKTDMVEGVFHGTPHRTSRRYVLLFDSDGREITFPNGAKPRQIIVLSSKDILVRCEDERFFKLKTEPSPFPVAGTGFDAKTRNKLSEYRVDKAYDCGEGKFLLRYLPFEETPEKRSDYAIYDVESEKMRRIPPKTRKETFLAPRKNGKFLLSKTFGGKFLPYDENPDASFAKGVSGNRSPVPMQPHIKEDEKFPSFFRETHIPIFRGFVTDGVSVYLYPSVKKLKGVTAKGILDLTGMDYSGERFRFLKHEKGVTIVDVETEETLTIPTEPSTRVADITGNAKLFRKKSDDPLYEATEILHVPKIVSPAGESRFFVPFVHMENGEEEKPSMRVMIFKGLEPVKIMPSPEGGSVFLCQCRDESDATVLLTVDTSGAERIIDATVRRIDRKILENPYRTVHPLYREIHYHMWDDDKVAYGAEIDWRTGRIIHEKVDLGNRAEKLKSFEEEDPEYSYVPNKTVIGVATLSGKTFHVVGTAIPKGEKFPKIAVYRKKNEWLTVEVPVANYVSHLKEANYGLTAEVIGALIEKEYEKRFERRIEKKSADTEKEI